MIEFIQNPWPWYIGGPFIGIITLLLLKLGGKQLGISSSFVYACGSVLPSSFNVFKNYQSSKWQMFFVFGIVIGGLIVKLYIPQYEVAISTQTIETLSQIGISKQAGYVPIELFNTDFKSLVILLFGGLFIGFGSRYAGGCTAGHTIMGVSQLSLGSILSSIGFFVGGILSSYFIVPYLF